MTTDHQYVAFPTTDEIITCRITTGALCELNSAIIPIHGLQSCELSLYLKEVEKTRRNCRVNTSPFLRGSAYSPRTNFWVVLTISPQVLHVTCLQGTTYITLKTPIDIIHLEDGCQGIMDTLILPGHNHLVKSSDSYLTAFQQKLFMLNYSDITDFQLIKHILPHNLSKEQLAQLSNKIPEFKDETVSFVKTKLKQIATDYPYIMLVYLKVLLSCLSAILLITVIAVCCMLVKWGYIKRVWLLYQKRWLRRTNTMSPRDYITDNPDLWRQHDPCLDTPEEHGMELQPLRRIGMTGQNLSPPRTPRRCSEKGRSSLDQPSGTQASNSAISGSGIGRSLRVGLQQVLQETGNGPEASGEHTARQRYSTRGSQQTAVLNDLWFVLCSKHFQDCVIIQPRNIDSCLIEHNYEVPSKAQIRNSYFKACKQCKNRTKVMTKPQNWYICYHSQWVCIIAHKYVSLILSLLLRCAKMKNTHQWIKDTHWHLCNDKLTNTKLQHEYLVHFVLATRKKFWHRLDRWPGGNKAKRVN